MYKRTQRRRSRRGDENSYASKKIFCEWIVFDKCIKIKEWTSGVGRFEMGKGSQGQCCHIRWSLLYLPVCIYCCGVFRWISARFRDSGDLKGQILTHLKRILIYHLCVGVVYVMHRLSKQVVIISGEKLSPHLYL